MIKKLITCFFFLLCLFEIVFFLIHTPLWRNYFIDTTQLWLYKVVVAIIPMYILSSCLISIPFLAKISYQFLKPLHLFENRKALSLFLISFLTGNPTSTILVKKAYLNKEISLLQASKIINSSSHVSFLFILVMFQSKDAIVLIVSQIIATLFLYLLHGKIELKDNYMQNNIDPCPILENINMIMEDLPIILLKILASMYLITVFKLPFLSFDNSFLNLLLGYLEVTTGINSFIALNLNHLVIILLCSSLLSLNGGAILLQVFNIIKKTRLSFCKYLIGRFYHLILSTIISLGLLLFI